MTAVRKILVIGLLLLIVLLSAAVILNKFFAFTTKLSAYYTAPFAIVLCAVLLPVSVCCLAFLFIREAAGIKKNHTNLNIHAALMDNTPLLLRNMNGEIVSWSIGMEELYGWKKEEALGNTTQHLFCTRYPQPLAEIEKILLATHCWQGELTQVKKDGTPVFVTSNWSLVLDNKGTFVGIAESSFDITALKKSAATAALLSQQINRSNDAIFVVDKNRLITSWNRGAEKIYGFSESEALGKEINTMLQTEMTTTEIDLAVNQLSAEGYWAGDLKRKKKDGTDVYVYSSTSTLKDAAGSITGYVGVSLDITEQRTLRQQADLLAAITNQSTDTIASVSMDIRLMSWNRGAENLHGYCREEALGKMPQELGMIQLTDEKVKDIFNSIIENGSWKSEMLFYHKLNGPFMGAINAYKITGKNGDISGVGFVIKDISERKKLEEQLLSYTTELEARVRERTREIISYGHRFRAMVENSNDIVSMMDASLNVTYRSPSSERISGWTMEEMKVDGIRKIHPDEIAYTRDIMQNAFAHPGKLFTVGFRILHKEGHYLNMEGTIINLLQDKEVQSIVSNLRDVTEKIAAEKRLLNSEKRFRLMVENTADIIALLDESFNITYRSPSAERLTGLKEADKNVSTYTFNFHPDDRPCAEQLLMKAAANPGKLIDARLRMLVPDGQTVWLDGTIVNMLQIEGVNAYILNCRDVTDKRKVEQALINSERKFRALIENSNDAIILMDHTLKTIYRSPSAARITGWSDEEALLVDRISNTHADDLPLIEKIYQQAINQPGYPVPLRFRFLHKQGYYVWLEGVITNWFGDSNVKAFVLNVRDVSEKVAAEQKLQVLLRELSDYRYALDESGLVTITDHRGIITHVNENFCQISQYTREELINREHRIINSGYHSKEFFRQLWTTIANGIIWKGEIKNKAKDGSFFWLDTVIIPFKDNNGKPFQYIALRSDITLRKQAEEKLAISEKRFRTLIENNFDAIILIDESAKTIYRSPSAARITGWSNEEIAAHPSSFFFVHPDDIEMLQKKMKEILESPGQPETIKFRYRHKLGHYLWLEGIITNWLQDENIKALVFNSRDVTERIAAEERLVKSEKRFRALIDNNYDVIALMNAQFKLIYRSPSGSRISGWSNEEMLNMDGTANIHPDDLPPAQKRISEMMNHPGKSYETLLRIRHKQGHYIWIEGVLTNRLNDDDVNAIVFNYRDVTGRIAAEEKLLASEKRFRTIIENNYEAILLIDESLKTVYRTPSAKRITGWSDEEMLNTNAVKIVHPDDLEKAAGVMKLATMNPGKPVNTLFRSLHKNGHYVWVDATIANHLNDENIKAFVFNYRDVTEKIKAEEKLLASESRLRSLIENVSDGIVLTDRETGIIYQSPSVTRITGYQPDERVGKRPADYVHPEDLQFLVDFNERLSNTTNTALPFQYRFRHKKGHYIWLEGWVKNLLHEPAVNAYVSNYRDITERKEAEVALQQSEKMFRSLFENMLNGFAYCRVIMNHGKVVDFVYESVNNAFETITGITNTIGRKHSEVFPGLLDADPGYAAMLTRIIMTRQPETFESYIPQLEKWLSVAVYSPNNTHFVSLIENITERKQSEQNIQQLNIALEEKVAARTKELTKVNEELEAFSYSVSHDLRAPLRGIIGFTAILEEEYANQLDNEARRITGIIKHNTLKMGNLIDDLLFFSRMGRHQIELSAINTNEMVEDIIAELDSSILKSSNKTVKWIIGSLPISYGDVAAIRQVWTNLLSNAVKYSGARPKPKVEIQFTLTENQQVFMIKDNGAGFDQQYSHKLFKVFQRLHAADEFEGTGVGLAIVEKIISKHGGKVWAEGVTGEGATFYFSLPCSKLLTNNNA